MKGSLHRHGPAIVLALALLGVALAAARTVGASLSRGYGGLGASVGAFYAQNTHGSGVPPLGLVYYAVDATRHGRVTAFHVTINVSPPFVAIERIAQVGGMNLPIDATKTNLNSDHCLVWHSKKLGKLIGMQYAAATTGSDNTTASLRAESKPHC